jgi:dihydroflavonol-4-reductase
MPRMETRMFNVNVRGTINVINACEKTSVERLIYTSSIHAILPSSVGISTDETNVIDPNLVEGDYSKSKALATLEVIKSSQNTSLECVIVCPTEIIGPYDYHSSYIGRTISLYCSRKFPAYISGGYDFVDVRDVATGTISASQNGNPRQHYILSGQQVTVEEFFNELQLNTRIPRPKIKIPMPLVHLASYASGFRS